MKTNAQDNMRSRILSEVMRGIGQNRVPGYHFTGNFFGTTFGKVDAGETLVNMAPGPHSTTDEGGISLGGLALLADIAMGTTIRANGDAAQRLVTARMHLEFSDSVANAPVTASSRYRRNFGHGIGRQHLSEVSICKGKDLICYGSGSFIAVPVPLGTPPLAPFPWRHPYDPPVTLPPYDELSDEERQIYQHAEEIINIHGSDTGRFIHAFLGFAPYRTSKRARAVMPNGPHVANRVGHLQGGLQLALAALTANTAMEGSWKLDSITGSFIRSGTGEFFVAESTIIHEGRLTAVVRTQITEAGRLLFESLSTHSRIAG
jgi:acyl-coenzyme A thioesterase PaaI-like protein